MSTHTRNEAHVIPLRPRATAPGTGPAALVRHPAGAPPEPAPREPLWRDLVGRALRRERQSQRRTLKEVAEAARISMPYLSELERGRKEASSEVLAAAARALGLDLADLLSRTQEELSRSARTRPRRTRASPSARYDVLDLAA